MKHEQLDYLLRILEDRDINLGRDDIQWAFESSKTKGDASAWVEEYLKPATLLSREELELCVEMLLTE
jgi:hypothetical protein